MSHFKFRFSMHTALSVTIMLMGLVGMLLVITTGEKYRRLALNDQVEAVENLVKIKANDLLRELSDRSRDMGLVIQDSKPFREAVDTANRNALKRFLDNQFHQYFVTAGLVRLEKLRVWNSDFSLLLAQSTEGTTKLNEYRIFCPDLIERARSRRGADRLRILSSLCVVDGTAYHSVLVPIGGLHARGYLEIVTDPAYGLVPIGSALGMPIQISHTNNVVYQSSNWPNMEKTKNILAMEYRLDFGLSHKTLKVAVSKDMTGFYAQLIKTRNNLLVVAGLVTVATILLSIYLLRKTTLEPLSNLVHKLQLNPRCKTEERRRKDYSLVREIDLLREIYASLEKIALTDPLTTLSNRTAAQEYLGRLVNENTPFALLLFDLDRFKEVNDAHGHHVGDQMLREVGARLKRVLRTSDWITRMDEQPYKKIAARLGGDEFVIILPAINNVPDAEIIARKLLKVMEQPFFFEGKKIQIDMSIGLALYPAHAGGKDDLLRRADQAMYFAKSNRLGFAVYNDISGSATGTVSKPSCILETCHSSMATLARRLHFKEHNI